MSDILNHRAGGASGGPALLLLHPLGGDLAFWDECRRVWEGEAFCVACDLRGAGASPKATSPVTVASNLADLEALRAHLGLERVVVVACAVATMTAIALAARMPARVSALVLSNPTRRTRPAAAGMLSARAGDVRRGGMAALLPGAIDNAFHGCPDDGRRAAYMRRFAAQDPEGYALSALGLPGEDVTGDLAGIAQPTLLVAGDNDRLLPPEHAVEIAERLPHAELEVLADGAHFIPYQQPDRFAGLVRGFLARHALV